MNKKIANVVFYKFNGERENMQQACIFYDDGTVKNVSLDEGIDAAYELAAAEKISKSSFSSMLNNEKFYTLSGEEFERRFQEFVVKATNKPAETALVPVVDEDETTTPIEPENTEENDIPVSIIPTTPIEPEEDEDAIDDEDEIEETVVATPSKNTEEPKKKKKSKIGAIFGRLKTRVIAGVLAVVMLITGSAFMLKRCSKEGEIINNNISISETDLEEQDKAYAALLDKTTNKDQKEAMSNQSEDLDAFNADFANAYVEADKDIKAALTWDEMMALNLAYNTYTKDQIKAMFNGAEVSSQSMTDAYKNATLQLMGAYIIETRENPVNVKALLNNAEHQAFAEKYHELFLKCKETTGTEQVEAVNNFYKELYKDFPITDEVREEGISHAEARKQLDQYKLVVVPMVAAAETMFRNLSVDHTLSDKAIKYFNDLGLCNQAEEQYERVETITLSADTDETNPTYTEFKTTKETELKTEDNYGISDSERDLSKLDAFAYWANGEFLKSKETTTSQSTTTSKPKTTTSSKTTTSTSTKTETTQTSNRSEAVDAVGEEEVKKAENQADQEIAAENEAAKSEGEKQAEANRQEMQAAADKEADKIKTEIENADREFQNIINNLNGVLSNGGTVNESDFGDFNVEFDPEYTDGNGNLADFVGSITTSPEGYNPSSTLPNPNTTGQKFDSEESYDTPSYNNSGSSNQGSSETPSYNNGGNSSQGTTSDLPDPNETGKEFDERYEESTDNYATDSTTVTDDEIYVTEEEYIPTTAAEVDAYVESLDGVGENTDAPKQYTK